MSTDDPGPDPRPFWREDPVGRDQPTPAYDPQVPERDQETRVRPAVGAPADATEVLTPTPAEPPTSGPRKPLVLVGAGLGGLVVLAAVLYVIGHVVAGDDLPRKATVSGVAVGGLSQTEAVARLTDELGPRADAPITVSVGTSTAQVSPTQAGLAVDYVASVEKAGGGSSWNPATIVRVLLGGTDTDAVVVADENKLEDTVATLAASVDQKPVNAGITYAGAKVTQTKAEPGVTLSQQAAATAIEEGYLSGATVALPVETAEPEVSDAEADQVVASYAKPAVSAAVTVKAGGAGSFTITPAMIGGALTFTAKDGTLVPNLDADQLAKNADDAIAKVETRRARDATVRMSDGKPKVVPAVDGTSVKADALAKAVEPVLTKTGAERTASITLDGAKAEFSTADATALGIKEVTGKFTTFFPYATYRNVNIGRAAELINNTVLKPGETFSLNKVVGERTKANGFTEGFIISDNKFKKELGGGVSQSATTTFNAMFFAGLKDVQHQPHTLFINRYPPGREATVAWPNLDLKFTNDTKYGVLVQAYVQKATPSSRGSITVKMWSTKTYDKVASSDLVQSDFTTGTDITDDSPDCEPQAPVRGFTVNYQRIFSNDGKVVKRENFRWRYGPTNKITCT